jgi:hypothetical protein
MAKKLSKAGNVKKWKSGINNVKNINSADYAKNKRGGIRLT